MKNRQDVQLCAYAIANGFNVSTTCVTEKISFDSDGMPTSWLAFELSRIRVNDTGAVRTPETVKFNVWETARGWRCAQLLANDVFEKPDESQFHQKLKAALDQAIARAAG